MTTVTRVIAHCRRGFEVECAADLAEAGIGAQRTQTTSAPALVVATVAPIDHAELDHALAQRPPVFARSIFFGAGPCELSLRDRITPVLERARCLDPPFSAIWLETADADEAKTRSSMCRRLAPLLEAAARRESLLVDSARERPRLHVLFTAATEAYVGVSSPGTGSPWPMGIPRLAMPHQAPSRSTLKLAEAFMTFLSDRELDVALKAGMQAVDLGAAPGGWTFQFVVRHIRVVAVDNGALAPSMAQDPLVEHLRTDGFRYRPPRTVDWMVCDMVEQPSRIAALAADWIAGGHCRRTVFNLKLPMKKRHAEIERCRSIVGERLAAAGVSARLSIRQLYHDREEATAYCRRAKP